MHKLNFDHNPNPAREKKVEDASVSHLLTILFILWMTGLAVFRIAT